MRLKYIVAVVACAVLTVVLVSLLETTEPKAPMVATECGTEQARVSQNPPDTNIQHSNVDKDPVEKGRNKEVGVDIASDRVPSEGGYISKTLEEMEAEWHREEVAHLEEVLRAAYGTIPSNPISGLKTLQETELSQMLLEQDLFSHAELIGQLSAETQDPETWLDWFDDSSPIFGIEGAVATTIFGSALGRKLEEIKSSPVHTRRALEVINRYFAACQGRAVNSDTLSGMRFSLEQLCPSSGALDIIRRWAVTTPLGHESIETGLVKLLRYWSVSAATPVVLEALDTQRAGAIKGIVSAWNSTKKYAEDSKSYSKWGFSEAKILLESPLAEAVKSTPSAAAVLYAAVFASKNLLKPRALEIADALLARRDNARASARGFHFLEVHSKSLANTIWAEWFESDDEYKVMAACKTAGSFRDVSATPAARNRLFELASNSHQMVDLQGLAGEALCQVDTDYARTLDVLHLLLSAPQIADLTLVSAARMVLWGPEAEVKEFLLSGINDPAKKAEERHTAMFLLALLDPDKALDVCFDARNYKSESGKLTDQTILLVAATAEGMDRDMHYQQGASLRKDCTEIEPDWVKRIRLQEDYPDELAGKRVEEDIVNYAWSRPR